MENIYYSPEAHGLEILGEVEESVSYQFNQFVVWRRLSDGTLFYASDSGCSCPSPFETYENVESLKRIDKQNEKTFESDLRTWSIGYSSGLLDDVSQSDLDSLTSKVREALFLLKKLSKMKLSLRQQEVIDLMKTGWQLGINYGFNTHTWIQKDGCGKGGDAKNVHGSTVFALENRKLIVIDTEKFPLRTYKLAEGTK